MKGFTGVVEALCEQLQIQLRQLDSKSARTLLAGHRETSLASLATCTDPVVAFHLVLTSLHIQLYKSIIYINSFNVTHLRVLFNLVKDKVTDDALVAQLTVYMDTLEAYMHVKDNKEDPTVADLYEKLKALQSATASHFLT